MNNATEKYVITVRGERFAVALCNTGKPQEDSHGNTLYALPGGGRATYSELVQMTSGRV